MKYEFRSVLFLGIGGISMYQLALAFKDLGVKVVGYDIKESKYTKICVEHGIKVIHHFNKDFCGVDLCVKTGAVRNKTTPTRQAVSGRSSFFVSQPFLYHFPMSGTSGRTQSV